jgi:hypothetical protein
MAVNNRADVAFIASITGGRALGGVFMAATGGISTIVALGDATPLGGQFGDFVPSVADDLADDSLFLNDAGTIAFGATVVGGSAPSGLFVARTDGQIQTAVAAGDEAPVAGRFTTLRLRAMNELGHIAFTASLSGGQEGLFVSANGVIQTVAASGDPVPNGGTFASFEAARLNQAGDVAFVAEVVPQPDSRVRDQGIFLFTGGRLSKIVRESEWSPIGGRFHEIDLLGGPALGEQGDVAFAADQRTVTIYRTNQGTVEVVARGGGPTQDNFFVYLPYTGFGLTLTPDRTVEFVGAMVPLVTIGGQVLPTYEAKAGQVRTVFVVLPESANVDRTSVSGPYLVRSSGGQIVYTLLFRDRQRQLEARQLFLVK